MKKLTLEDFTKLANEVHNNEYSYDKSVFINTKFPIQVTCKKHGDFEVLPSVHLRGAKCKQCKKDGIVNPEKTEAFIALSKEIHGDAFDYSKVQYVNDKTKVTIICKKHGEFETTPAVHKQGFKCPVCRYGGDSDEKLANFLLKAKEVHSDRNYDYSQVAFKILTDKVKIICPEHGEFSQCAGNHLQGQKCPVCAKIEGDSKQDAISIADLIARFRVIHGDKYQYEFKDYGNVHSKITITCPKHGSFEQFATNHLQKAGCYQCGIERQSYNNEIFIEKAKQVHGHRYDYSNIQYKNAKTKVEIKCPIHGAFMQSFGAHVILKAGCPSCSHTTSKFEIWVADTIKAVSDIAPTKYKMKNNKDIDVLYKNIGFEANGLLFHREGLVLQNLMSSSKGRNYHLDKTNQAAAEGITLYHIFENEYLENPELVKNKILNACGLNTGKKAHGRACKIKEVSSKESNEFLAKYHIQKGDVSPIRYGAWLDGELVGVMTFKRTKVDGVFELNRYAVNYNYHVRGLASKMLNHFEKLHLPTKVTTFADIRWTPKKDDNLYVKIGFTLIEQQPPVYHYYNPKTGTKLYNRINFQKHKILQNNLQFNESMTEKQMMVELGYDRVWDCGNWKFEKTYNQ